MLILDFLAYVAMCVIGVISAAAWAVTWVATLIGPAGIVCLVICAWLWSRMAGE